jgi:hypothetical protein
MNDSRNVSFPQYRKYKNNKHFFKIISETEFEEISFIGSKIIVATHVATIFPDKLLIQDLLFDIGGTSEISSEAEFEALLKSQ